MARYIDAKDTAKIIRKVLKKEFPTTKFSVRIHRYSGGSSVNISWTDGAGWEKVNTALLPFNGKHFDGMTDMASYRNTIWEGEEVCFAQYISVDRNTTRAFIDRVFEYCQDRFGHHAENLKIVGSETSSSFDVDDYYENEWILREARKIVRESSSDRVFNWEVEKQQNKQREKLEEKAIANQKAKDEKYLMSLSVPQDYAQFSNAETEEWKVLAVKAEFRRTDYYIHDNAVTYGGYGNHQLVPAPETRDDIRWRFVVEVYRSGQESSETRRSTVRGKHAGKPFVELTPAKEYWDLETLLRKVDPIIPVKIHSYDFPVQVSGKRAGYGETNDINHLYIYAEVPESELDSESPEWTIQVVKATEMITLSQAHYDRFVVNLLNTYEWLKGKGGWDTDTKGLPDVAWYKLSEAQQDLWREHSYAIAVAVQAEDRDTILVNPDGRSHAEYVIFPDDVGVKELTKYCASTSNIIDFPNTVEDTSAEPSSAARDVRNDSSVEYASSDDRMIQQTLDNHYKTWVQDLIACDRLTEIIDYEAWRKTYGQIALEQQYKNFVTQCLEDELYLDIISFDNWLVCH